MHHRRHEAAQPEAKPKPKLSLFQDLPNIFRKPCEWDWRFERTHTPWCCPGEDCTKVEDKYSGVMMAPVLDLVLDRCEWHGLKNPFRYSPLLGSLNIKVFANEFQQINFRENVELFFFVFHQGQ
jgi:hypothetical protein